MTGRVVLVTVSPRVAPGLLAPAAWSAVTRAERVITTDPAWAAPLREGGCEVLVVGAEAPVADEVRRLLPASGSGDVALLGSQDEVSAVRANLAALTTLAGLDADGGPDGPAAQPEVVDVEGSWDLPGARLIDAVAVMDRLRSPGGCPWDAEQTHETLARYAVEEADEVAEAIAGLADGSHRYEDLQEELGDLLLQVLFNARVASEGSHAAAHGQTLADHPFDIDDVADTLVAKLRRRHPHVFGDGTATTPEDVEAEWARIKAEERAAKAARRETPTSVEAVADLPVREPAGRG